MSISASSSVVQSREVLFAELAKALERFRREGVAAAPILVGDHGDPEAVVIPFELYVSLLPLIEDLEIAHLVRDRAAAGAATRLRSL